MRTIVKQSVVLPAPAEKLCEMFLDPAQHGAFTGHAVTIGDQPGSPFSAFGGALSGATLAVVRPTLVVMSWRSVAFKPENPDSTLILTFTPQGKEGRIDLVHVDVPQHDYDGVTKGWKQHYWDPWRAFLEKR